MIDMARTVAPKSDQLNADDLIGLKDGITVTITKVSECGGDQPIAISFEGDRGKPYKPCLTMRRLLIQLWERDGEQYVGRRLTLVRDPSVKFGSLEVGGIRISHASHIDDEKPVVLTHAKGVKKVHKIKPLKMQTTSTAVDVSADADAAALNGMNAYKVFVASLPKDQQRGYVATEGHAKRKEWALTMDRLSACTDVIELEAEWDATPPEVCAALGADVLDGLRAKMGEG